MVYVNFAQIEDFMFLNRTLQIETRGKICIGKYGRIFRGDKGRIVSVDLALNMFYHLATHYSHVAS